MAVILYTTHCPKCNVLEKKLNKTGMTYTILDDVQEMLKLGFKTAPILKVDDQVFSFKEACLWADNHAVPEGECDSCKLT